MTVRFLFDVISPYAYLAWTQVHVVAHAAGHDVEPVPILFAALLGHHGTRGPAEVPAKRAYVFKDCLRTADALGVPLSLPPAHPFNPLLALRVAGLDMPPDVRRRLIDGLFAQVWGGGRGVEDPAVVAQVAADAGVPDALTRAALPDAKARLRDATDAAIAAGVFGVPSMLVDDELFWGLDSLGNLARHLRGEVRVDAAAVAAWETLRPSAVRPGSAG